MTSEQADRTLGAHLRPETLLDQPDADVVRLSAGHGAADLPGATNLCLQAAVDYAAGLGGGIVDIRPGRYLMHDSLHLRPRVTVRGAGAGTLLVKAPMVASPIGAYLGYGHYDVTVARPDLFTPGMGIHIQDDRSGGFYTTGATVIYRQGDRLGINRPLCHDYHPNAHAVARSLFPVLSAVAADEVRIEDLTIDGDAEHNDYLTGCRGGGVFLLGSDRAILRRLTVRNVNGDGISFQQCRDVLVEECRAEENRGYGFHPGSGSVRATMRRLAARRNGSDGLYYCLRVSHGLLEDSEFVGNGRHGLSIGSRDTDHLIRRCVVRENGGAGVYLRPSDAATAPSRNVVSACTIEGNLRASRSAKRLRALGLTGSAAEVSVTGPVEGVVLEKNHIRPAAPPPAGWAGILIGADVRSVTLRRNRIGGPAPRRVIDRRKPGRDAG